MTSPAGHEIPPATAVSPRYACGMETNAVAPVACAGCGALVPTGSYALNRLDDGSMEPECYVCLHRRRDAQPARLSGGP